MKRAIATLLSLLGAAPGYASERIYSARETAVAAHEWAECATRRNRDIVVRILQAPPGSEQESRQFQRLADRTSQCLVESVGGHNSVRMRFQPDTMRGKFAEVLYEKDFYSPANPRRGGLAELPDLVQLAQDPNLTPEMARHLLLRTFASCVVEAQSQKVAELMATDPVSPEEAAVIEQLTPTLGACLLEGRRLEANRPMLRGILAEALYRYSVAWTRRGSQ